MAYIYRTAHTSSFSFQDLRLTCTGSSTMPRTSHSEYMLIASRILGQKNLFFSKVVHCCLLFGHHFLGEEFGCTLSRSFVLSLMVWLLYSKSGWEAGIMKHSGPTTEYIGESQVFTTYCLKDNGVKVLPVVVINPSICRHTYRDKGTI